MTFQEYIAHYTEMPQFMYMALVSVAVMVLMHLFIFLFEKIIRHRAIIGFQKYYEMIISATCMLLFIGIYFLIQYRYLGIDDSFYEIWDKYNDFLLLLFLMIAVILMNIFDNIFVPLKHLERKDKSTLRMMAMIYMLVIFAYIKFIYENNNYDEIIVYFILMIIGRFIYFDASFRDFLKSIKSLFQELPILILALITSGIMAYVGFSSGYLLKSNGVVLSLCIAHLFLLIEIVFANIVALIRG